MSDWDAFFGVTSLLGMFVSAVLFIIFAFIELPLSIAITSLLFVIFATTFFCAYVYTLNNET